MSKRILALLFAAVMLTVCFTACTGDTEVSEPENSTATTTTTEAAGPGETTLPEEGETTLPEEGETTLPEEGATTAPEGPTTTIHGRPSTQPPSKVTIATTTVYTTKAGATLAKDKVVDLGGHIMTYNTPWRWQNTVSASDLGDILWHEMMYRTMEDYNCTVTVKNVYADVSTVKTYIMAGKTIGDITCMLFGSMYLPALGAGYLQSWDDIKDSPINKADARWRISQAGISAFDNKLYGLYFDFCAGVPELRHVVFANKTMLTNNGLSMDELWAAVDSKQWDWDMMRDYALATTKDTNSDGINDTWGIGGQYGFMFYDFVWSNGGRMITIENGSITATMDSEANVEAVSYLNQLINTDKVVYFPESFYAEETWGASGSYDSTADFLDGKFAFLFHEAWNLSQHLLPKAKFEYVMLPIPMGPKAKDYVMPADNCATDVILRTVSEDRATKAAIIYNAWARPIDDNLDYSEDYEEEIFQASDKKSMEVLKMLGDKYLLDYGTGVSAMSVEFNHMLVSSLLWKVQSPVEAIQSLSGNYNTEISAIFAGAVKN